MSEKRVSTTDFEESVQISLQDEKPVVVIENTKHELSVKACPVKNVTVFVDRAEVNRIVEAEIKQGEVEVLVKDLPALIDKDSVRVTCFGPATIVEVAYQSKAISEKKENADEIAKQSKSEVDQIKTAIKSLEKQKTVLREKVALLNKEKRLLEDFSACVSATKKDKVGEILEKKSIDNFLSFMTMYKDRHEKLTSALLEANQEIEEIDKEINVHQTNMKKHKPVLEETKQERNISVLLDASKNGKVTLVVSYVVSNASWTPLYDVRAFNKDSTVQILYFATIKQNTGEDWEDAKLSLSTAMPSVGGSPPKLTIQNLNINMPPVRAPSRGLKSSFRKKHAVMYEAKFSAALSSTYDPTIEDCYGGLPQVESQLPTAMTNEGMTSATFEIARTATIQSDDVGHKVSIAQLDFKPEFEYISTPKLVSHAFLKVKAKNESAYALLSGDANVFLDNNFLTKSFLPAVSPMEEFEIALGADAAVKVEYKPVRKFQQTSGMLSKSKVYNYHQVIEVKNTKSDSINITVTDQLPRSCNDKIKVTLQDPEIKIPKQSASNEPSVVKAGNATLHTTDNSIDWLLNIPPNETKKINLKYQIEHPLDACITGIP